MSQKRILITIDVGNRPEWQIRALCKQFADSVSHEANLKDYFFMLFPIRNQPTCAYSFDGDPSQARDAKELNDIVHLLRPLLKVVIDENVKETNKPSDTGRHTEGPQILE